jgi:polygalacturonase
LTIKGNGSVDGFGYSWWWFVITGGHDFRPRMFALSSGVNTLIDGINLYNSPQFHLQFYDQVNSTVQNVRVHVNITDNEDEFLKWLPTFPLNTDGIDVSGKNIHLKNLTIQNFDDAVAVKPLKSFDSIYTNCTENVLVEDSFIKYGVGMSVGSVPPDLKIECVRNVTFRNIKFEKPLKAIYVKPNPGNILMK